MIQLLRVGWKLLACYNEASPGWITVVVVVVIVVVLLLSGNYSRRIFCCKRGCPQQKKKKTSNFVGKMCVVMSPTKK